MSMKRRDAIKAISGAVVVSIAGCSSEGETPDLSSENSSSSTENQETDGENETSSRSNDESEKFPLHLQLVTGLVENDKVKTVQVRVENQTEGQVDLSNYELRWDRTVENDADKPVAKLSYAEKADSTHFTVKRLEEGSDPVLEEKGDDAYIIIDMEEADDAGGLEEGDSGPIRIFKSNYNTSLTIKLFVDQLPNEGGEIFLGRNGVVKISGQRKTGPGGIPFQVFVSRKLVKNGGYAKFELEALGTGDYSTDLSNAEIVWNGPSEVKLLEYDQEADSEHFTIKESETVINKEDEKLTLVIDVESVTGNVLSSGDVQLQVHGEHGAASSMSIEGY